MRRNIDVKRHIGRPIVGVLVALTVMVGLWPQYICAEAPVAGRGTHRNDRGRHAAQRGILRTNPPL